MPVASLWHADADAGCLQHAKTAFAPVSDGAQPVAERGVLGRPLSARPKLGVPRCCVWTA
jgi:hypothetical protein